MRLFISILIGVITAVAALLILQTSAPEERATNAPARVETASNHEVKLDAALAPFQSFIGTHWRGVPTGDSTERAADIQTWEAALGGKALLIRHAIEDGSYGGHTYVYPDAKSGALSYVYVTNAGFHTVGTFEIDEDGSWSAEEDVAGQGAITRVRSTGRKLDDGRLSVSSEYLRAGEWEPGHGFIYEQTDAPLPRLKSNGAD